VYLGRLITDFATLVLKSQYGPIHLYYGCREKALQIYSKEVAMMKEAGVINEDYIALSRSGNQKVKSVGW
jgi:hypothetical protein